MWQKRIFSTFLGGSTPGYLSASTFRWCCRQLKVQQEQKAMVNNEVVLANKSSFFLRFCCCCLPSPPPLGSGGHCASVETRKPLP